MGSQFEDALRSDLPGLSIRIPGTASEVRVYGFAKGSGYSDFGPRNQNNAPAPQTIPLADSPAALQGGDTGMTARFSRIGVDTRTLTALGTLETRIEGDFGGGPPASNNFIFRLRQAWGELGTKSFRVLVGQANSLWNEGMFETLNDSTNLNQSFVRQTQIRFTGLLAPGLTGQVSLEMPETQFTSAAGVFTPETSFLGGLSPAFNTVPDLLGRLNYRADGLELDTRGLLRDLNIRTAGTAAAPPFRRHAYTWLGCGHACACTDAMVVGSVWPRSTDRHGLLWTRHGSVLCRQLLRSGFAVEHRSAKCQRRSCADRASGLWRNRSLPTVLDAPVAHQHRLLLCPAGISLLCAGVHAGFGVGDVLEQSDAAGDRQSDLESLRDASQRLRSTRGGSIPALSTFIRSERYLAGRLQLFRRGPATASPIGFGLPQPSGSDKNR